MLTEAKRYFHVGKKETMTSGMEVFFRKQGFLVADSTGMRQEVIPEGNQFGLLLDTRGYLGRFIEVATLHGVQILNPLVAEIKTDTSGCFDWSCEVYGERYLEMVKDLALQTSEEFGKKIYVHLSGKETKWEKLITS